jgi:hypothetical protein
MFKTVKTILAGILAAVIVIAIGASVYTAFAAPGANIFSAQPQISSTGIGNGGNGNGGQGGGQGQGKQGQGGQGQGAAASGTPQANITGATTIHGTVVSFDQMGLSLTLDDGSAFYVQLGNSRYSQSIGFAPATGEGVKVYGFPGDQGNYTAITVTMDSTGQVYSFRDATGRPLWAGGNGNGKGGGGNGNGGGNH